jgi:hypothetical protein
MIYVKRSVDVDKEVTWVAADLDEIKRRCVSLYVGNDVNGAIEAATKAGMHRQAAEAQARQEIERCKKEHNDEIKA